MGGIFARKALLADGWADNVRLDIEAGRITAIAKGAAATADDSEFGVAIPGLANAHSHAFQRLLAGHTEERGPAGKDNFWTWRSRMYSLAGKIDARALTAIARQAYGEMVATGYTSVAEFHYLHNEPDGTGPSDAMFEAIVAAAEASGIRLTYVPVLYERAGFDEPQPTAEQRRFALSIDDFLLHYEQVKTLAGGRFTVGIGAHSLRAVTPDSLARLAAIAAADAVPMHIHIAEQQREVEQCLSSHGVRPVAWLLDQCDVNEQWCLVHATHIDDEEIAAIADCGAVVCLCPSTEANLGDGLFPLQRYLQRGGRLAIGSDSHVSINPFEELRWLEYGQRLVAQQRNIAAVDRNQTGRSLFERAAEGGALATGQAVGSIRTGDHADLVLLDDHSPMLAGHSARSLLDALVFSGFSLPIDGVMVDGEWQVVDGRHLDAEKARQGYLAVAHDLYRDTAPA